MTDLARRRIERAPAAARWAVAALLIAALLRAAAANGQAATRQRPARPVPTGKLAGRVLGVDGKPAAKARVYCQSSDGRSPHTAKTDANGHFQLTCAAGPVDVRARAGEDWSEWMRDVRVRTGETTSITLHIAAPKAPAEKKENPGTRRH